MNSSLPDYIEKSLTYAHLTWQTHLRAGLCEMLAERPNYLLEIGQNPFLPTQYRLFAAFAQPVTSVRYVLLGEGPYPRAESATGFCFIDGAVNSLWQSEVGLSKPVNRATSLRNFIKMLLVAEGILNAGDTGGSALKAVATQACAANSHWTKTAAELQENLLAQGFLLLNASLIFRNTVAPSLDARAWLPFLRVVLRTLSAQNNTTSRSIRSEPVKLILWGKIAEKINDLPEAANFLTLISEHPYNLSFINNPIMQGLFKQFHLLKRES
ncbi:MAG: uracil-DNA glycosylase [Solimicrobium sp.]|jgi:uracil-DNA glycosylase|nr:uracil-DNA glycosylase [Solimicrobium sp.]